MTPRQKWCFKAQTSWEDGLAASERFSDRPFCFVFVRNFSSDRVRDWQDKFHGSSESFWIWVEDADNEHIYHSESFQLHKSVSAPIGVVSICLSCLCFARWSCFFVSLSL